MQTDVSDPVAPGSRILGLGAQTTGAPQNSSRKIAAVVSPGRVVVPPSIQQVDRRQQASTQALTGCSVSDKAADVTRHQQACTPSLAGCSTLDKPRENQTDPDADLRSTSFNLDPIATLVSVEMGDGGHRPVHKGAPRENSGVSAWVGGLCCPERSEANRAKTVRGDPKA
mmetsp:Transcript_42150/g.91857  ORF Transcript_42150/g.91857 Transcript_42150/m.91857 type:complete len:170 (+) Transcript_42150:88-597(+)